MALITSWEEEGLTKGLKQGTEQGEQREAGVMTLHLLRRRFGLLPEALEAQVAGLSKALLEDLAEALLDFTDLADVKGWPSTGRGGWLLTEAAELKHEAMSLAV